MPRILVFGQYVLFFWIAENGEPVHIHVGVKRAAANSTKFWLTKWRMHTCEQREQDSG